MAAPVPIRSGSRSSAVIAGVSSWTGSESSQLTTASSWGTTMPNCPAARMIPKAVRSLEPTRAVGLSAAASSSTARSCAPSMV